MKKLAVGLFLVLFSPFAFSAVPCEGFSDEDIGKVIDYNCIKSRYKGEVCTRLTYIGNNRCLVNQIDLLDQVITSTDDETSSDSNLDQK